MKRTYALSISLLLLVSLFSSAVGQTVTGPVLLSRPDLVLPDSGGKYVASGEIRAWVIVDNEGNVVRISSIEGPGWVCPSIPGVAEIHQAAREAAAKAKFVPAGGDGSLPERGAMITFDDYVSPPTPVYAAGTQERFTVMRGPIGADGTKKNVQAEKKEGTPDAAANANNPPDAPPPDYRGPVKIDSGVLTARSGTASGTLNRPLRPISGGVLNGKAKTLARPAYPPAAKAVRASGSVTVQVLIDESGTIVSAEPISGHPLLRSASRFAACGSEFSPTMLEGRPVKVSGVITYNFTL